MSDGGGIIAEKENLVNFWMVARDFEAGLDLLVIEALVLEIAGQPGNDDERRVGPEQGIG